MSLLPILRFVKIRNANYSFQISPILNSFSCISQLKKTSSSLTFSTWKGKSSTKGTSLKESSPKSTVLDLFHGIPVTSVASRPKFYHFLNMSATGKDEDCMDANRLVWIDLEMTGLNVEKERIIEIACLVTEGDLTIVAKGPNLVIHQEDKLLDSMDEWCTQHHGQSGLTEAVQNSKISTEEAEAKVLSFVQQYVPQGKCPLAGNSVSMDKLFLERYMPRLAQHLHYRIVDVSTVKELCRRWYPEDFKRAPVKRLTHRAMDDIIESVEELKYYRAALFKS